MIKINNKEYRNLEEQVGFLTAAYDANRVIAEFGINVLGTVPNTDYLPQEYEGNYGDAYAVGENAPYDFYIWTRANESAGHLDPYWFNIGELAIVGPQGPQGPKGNTGETGPRGSLWYAGKTKPTFSGAGYKAGDMYLDGSTGNVYRYKETGVAWQDVGNIQGPRGYAGPTGPQGEQGPRGETGPQGPTGPIAPGIVISGVLNSINELPDPNSIKNLSTAYVVNNNLFIQVGTSPATADWVNMGSFNGGTTVFKNGQAVLTWDSNTKLDKVTTTGGLRSYCVGGTGGQEMVRVTQDTTANTIARRTKNGRLVAADAVENNELLTLKQYKEKSYTNSYKHSIYIPLTYSSYFRDVTLCYTFYNNSPEYMLQNDDDKLRFLFYCLDTVMFKAGDPTKAYCIVGMSDDGNYDALLEVVDSNDERDNVTLHAGDIYEQITTFKQIS